MVLARNTYRFGLLVIGFSIAEGVRTMGGYGADLAAIGFLVGAVGLFTGTLAHLARGPEESGADRTDRSGGNSGEGGASGDEATPDDENDESPVTTVAYGWH